MSLGLLFRLNWMHTALLWQAAISQVLALNSTRLFRANTHDSMGKPEKHSVNTIQHRDLKCPLNLSLDKVNQLVQ